MFLDADDRLLPHHLETSLRTFEQNPSAAMVVGDYRYFGDGDLWHLHDCERGGDLYPRLLLGGFPGAPCVVMVRRAILKELGAFRTSLRASEDYDLWLRIARVAPATCHHAVVAEYRQYAGRVSQQWDLVLRCSAAGASAAVALRSGTPAA